MPYEKHYDLIVIGGGSGGLVAAAGAAKLGAKVALVEKHKLGGECLWTGCVPSKALIHAAKVAHDVANAKDVGIAISSAKVNFNKVIDYVHKVIKTIQPHDSPERFRKMGVDVFFGTPRFEDRRTLIVGNERLYGKKFVIATGSRPAKLPIKGLEEAGYLTNETIFENKKFPATLLVIGGGPIGSEMAQAFARLGSKVTIFERGEHILSKEEPEVSAEMEEAFVRENITILTNSNILQVEKKGGKKVITYDQKGKKGSVAGDEILFAVGRAPNVEGLNLEGIGIKYDQRAIQVNDYLQTTVPNIYAIGDVKGKYQFTHMAAYEAGVVLMNALFHLPIKANYSVVPWTTFTDPEVARVGITEQESREKHPDALVFKAPFEDVDRAQCENTTTGFIKIIADKKGHLLGVHIVGPHAGELLAEFTLAKRKGLTVKDIFNTIHVYPTLSLINAQIAAKFMERKLTERAKRWLKFLFRYG